MLIKPLMTESLHRESQRVFSLHNSEEQLLVQIFTVELSVTIFGAGHDNMAYIEILDNMSCCL